MRPNLLKKLGVGTDGWEDDSKIERLPESDANRHPDGPFPDYGFNNISVPLPSLIDSIDVVMTKSELFMYLKSLEQRANPSCFRFDIAVR